MDADGADIAREREKSFRERPFLELTKMEGAETEPAFGTQKRAADRDACTQDHSTATKMLQQLLPMLRPHQTGSLSCEARLALLIDAWVKQAGAQHQLASSDRAQLASVLQSVQPHSKSRFKKQVGDMWDLIEKAAAEEKAELASPS